MEKLQIISKTVEFVKKQLDGEGSGHIESDGVALDGVAGGFCTPHIQSVPTVSGDEVAIGWPRATEGVVGAVPQRDAHLLRRPLLLFLALLAPRRLAWLGIYTLLSLVSFATLVNYVFL